MLRPKKNSYKEFDNEKKFLRLENSLPLPPPHNFSDGPSFSWYLMLYSRFQIPQEKTDFRSKTFPDYRIWIP